MNKAYILLLLAWVPLGSHAQKCRFVSEKLEMRIDRTWFTVKGEYTFSNPAADTVTAPIAYPVPSYGMRNTLDTLAVMSRTSPPAFLPVRLKDTVASFSLTIPPKSEKTVWIYYKQRHPKGYAKYFLSMAAKWEQPLEYAKYTLFAGRGTDIRSFSIPYDSKRDTGGGITYQWERRNYLPNKDLEIRY